MEQNNMGDLALARQKLNRYKEIESWLERYKDQLKEQQLLALEYLDELQKEQDDVMKLQRITPASLLYVAIGLKQNRLEKEQEEVYQVKQKYEKLKNQMQDEKTKKNEIEEEKKQYIDCEFIYDELRREKRLIIKRNGGEDAERMLNLEKKINTLSIHIDELEETYKEGKYLLSAIDKTGNKIAVAGVWAIMDFDLLKYASIDGARDDINAVNMMLGDFRSQLAGVRMMSNVNLYINQDTRELDYWDWGFTEYRARAAVYAAHRNIEEARCEVEGVENKLNWMIEKEQITLEVMQKELTRFMEQS